MPFYAESRSKTSRGGVVRAEKKARNDPVTLKHCCNYSIRMDVLLVVANDGVFADHDYRLCRQIHQRVIFDHASRKRAFFLACKPVHLLFG